MGKDLLKARVRNDLTLHPPAHPAVGAAMGAIRVRALELAEFLIDTVPEGRELSMALTDVEAACQHAIAALARNQDTALLEWGAVTEEAIVDAASR